MTTRNRARKRGRQRGSAMLVTMIIIAALLAGGAVLVSLQLASNRSSDLTRSSMSALYCAEAGLSAARPIVAANNPNWGDSLAASAGGDLTEPDWLVSGIGSHDLDGDGDDDFDVYIRDNADEGAAANDASVDKDLTIYIVAKCTMYPDTPKEVSELVLYNGGVPCYDAQSGGEDGNGNKNDGC